MGAQLGFSFGARGTEEVMWVHKFCVCALVVAVIMSSVLHGAQCNKHSVAGDLHGGPVLRKGSKLQLLDLAFLLARSLVVQLPSMGHPSNPSAQEKRLRADISILGGNRTGIYVQWVKPGSQVEDAGLREGCRLIEVSPGMSSLCGFARH